jgi:hypothetical protein
MYEPIHLLIDIPIRHNDIVSGGLFSY